MDPSASSPGSGSGSDFSHLHGPGSGPGPGLALLAPLQHPTTAIAAIVTLVATLFIAIRHLRPHSPYRPPSGSGSPSLPPQVPTWTPLLGHTPHLFLWPTAFLTRLRSQYPNGIFSLRQGRHLHHIIHRPSLASALLNQPTNAAETPSSQLFVSVFACPPADQTRHAAMVPELRGLLTTHLLAEPGLGELVSSTATFLTQHIADLVTFNSSPADQTDWERLAGAEVVEDARGGREFVETDLMELTRNFVAMTANRAFFGTDLVGNSPEMWPLLWAFDDAFTLLSASLPSWLPWGRLQRARRARRHLLAILREFNTALDAHATPGDDDDDDDGDKNMSLRWPDLDNVSALVQARHETFIRHGLSLDARASCDLALLWAINANPNHLVAWLLWELYRDPVLLEQVREEIAPHVRVSQPVNHFGAGVWLPPQLEMLHVEGLARDCPVLKAAYVETLRVYTAIWATRRVLCQDVVLQDSRGPAVSEPASMSYLLPKGSHAHVVNELHQMDPERFPEPHEWRHARHLRETDDEKGGKTWEVVDTDAVRPFGGGPGMCKGRAFAMREVLLYAAVIISFYDMQPPRGQSWEQPKTRTPVGTRQPTSPIKVWIKRREHPPSVGEVVTKSAATT